MRGTRTVAASLAAGTVWFGATHAAEYITNKVDARRDRIAFCAPELGKIAAGEGAWTKGSCALKKNGTVGAIEKRFRIVDNYLVGRFNGIRQRHSYEKAKQLYYPIRKQERDRFPPALETPTVEAKTLAYSADFVPPALAIAACYAVVGYGRPRSNLARQGIQEAVPASS